MFDYVDDVVEFLVETIEHVHDETAIIDWSIQVRE